MIGVLWMFVGFVTLAALLGTLMHSVGGAPRAAVEELVSKRGTPTLERRVRRILDDAASHARSLGLAKLVCELGAVVCCVAYVAELRHTPTLGAPDGLPVSPDIFDALIGVGISAAVLWVCGMLVPMSIARHAGARVVFSRSLILRGLDVLFRPLRGIGSFSDEVVRRLAGVTTQGTQEQVEAELLSVIEEGEATGALGEQERDMLEAVVKFGDLTVEQIMTPRTEIEAMQVSNDLGMVVRIMRELGHSRIPVYDESLDTILGIFYVKDLMHWLGDGPKSGKAFDLKSILRPALFVPETKTVRELLNELMDKKVHIALVADEYGGTAGLVTIEDIIEEIFGEIRDEYEPTTPEMPDVVMRVEQRDADIDGAARIADVNDHLESLGVQIPTSEEYDTVGGFVTTTLGRIPSSGETFAHENMTFTIVEAKPTKVVRVHMSVRSDEPSEVESTARQERDE